MDITYPKSEFDYYEVRFGNAWSGYIIEKTSGNKWLLRNCWAKAGTNDVLFKADTLKYCKEFVQANLPILFSANELEWKKRSAINTQLEKTKKATQAQGDIKYTFRDAYNLCHTSDLIEICGDRDLVVDMDKPSNESFGVYAWLSAYLQLISKKWRSRDIATTCSVALTGFGGSAGSTVSMSFANGAVKANLVVDITNTRMTVTKKKHLNMGALGIVNNSGKTSMAVFNTSLYSVQRYIDELTELLRILVAYD